MRQSLLKFQDFASSGSTSRFLPSVMRPLYMRSPTSWEELVAGDVRDEARDVADGRFDQRVARSSRSCAALASLPISAGGSALVRRVGLGLGDRRGLGRCWSRRPGLGLARRRGLARRGFVSVAGLVSAAGVVSHRALVSVPDLAAGGGAFSPEHPTSTTAAKATTPPNRVSASTGLTYFTDGAEGGAGAVESAPDWAGAEGAGVEGARTSPARPGALGSRTTDDERSPPRMARLNDVTAKRSATLVVILPSSVGVPMEPNTAWLPAPPKAEPISAPCRPAAVRCR